MVTRCNTAAMNYINYDTQIMQRYQVKLVGYTYHEFTSPYNIATVDDLRLLRDALRCGSCCWIRLTKGEVSKHAKEIANREAAGEVVTTKRKERSDKGKKRKRTAKELDAEDEDDPGPSKRQRVAKKTPVMKAVAKKTRKKVSASAQLPPSNEFIATEDDLTDKE